LTAVYMLGALRKGVAGPPAVDVLKVLDASSLKSRLPYLILLAALLAVGVCPRLLTDPVQRGLTTLKATPVPVSLTTTDKR